MNQVEEFPFFNSSPPIGMIKVDPDDEDDDGRTTTNNGAATTVAPAKVEPEPDEPVSYYKPDPPANYCQFEYVNSDDDDSCEEKDDHNHEDQEDHEEDNNNNEEEEEEEEAEEEERDNYCDLDDDADTRRSIAGDDGISDAQDVAARQNDDDCPDSHQSSTTTTTTTDAPAAYNDEDDNNHHYYNSVDGDDYDYDYDDGGDYYHYHPDSHQSSAPASSPPPTTTTTDAAAFNNNNNDDDDDPAMVEVSSSNDPLLRNHQDLLDGGSGYDSNKSRGSNHDLAAHYNGDDVDDAICHNNEEDNNNVGGGNSKKFASSTVLLAGGDRPPYLSTRTTRPITIVSPDPGQGNNQKPVITPAAAVAANNNYPCSTSTNVLAAATVLVDPYLSTGGFKTTTTTTTTTTKSDGHCDETIIIRRKADEITNGGRNNNDGGGGGRGESKEDKKNLKRGEGGRKTDFSMETNTILRAWLFKNSEHPYPCLETKYKLMAKCHITKAQLDNWFTNARRRILRRKTRQEEIAKSGIWEGGTSQEVAPTTTTNKNANKNVSSRHHHSRAMQPCWTAPRPPPPEVPYTHVQQQPEYEGPPPPMYRPPPPPPMYRPPPPPPPYRGPPPHHAYGGPPPHQAYGGPPPHQAYGGPPPHQAYGGPPPHQAYRAPPPHQAYRGPPPHQAYRGPHPPSRAQPMKPLKEPPRPFHPPRIQHQLCNKCVYYVCRCPGRPIATDATVDVENHKPPIVSDAATDHSVAPDVASVPDHKEDGGRIAVVKAMVDSEDSDTPSAAAVTNMTTADPVIPTVVAEVQDCGDDDDGSIGNASLDPSDSHLSSPTAATPTATQNRRVPNTERSQVTVTPPHQHQEGDDHDSVENVQILNNSRSSSDAAGMLAAAKGTVTIVELKGDGAGNDKSWAVSLPAPQTGQEPVTVEVKKQQGAKLGLVLCKVGGKLVVIEVQEGGLVDGTELAPGMEISSINGIKVESTSNAARMVEAAKSTVTIVALKSNGAGVDRSLGAVSLLAPGSGLQPATAAAAAAAASLHSGPSPLSTGQKEHSKCGEYHQEEGEGKAASVNESHDLFDHDSGVQKPAEARLTGGEENDTKIAKSEGDQMRPLLLEPNLALERTAPASKVQRQSNKNGRDWDASSSDQKRQKLHHHHHEQQQRLPDQQMMQSQERELAQDNQKFHEQGRDGGGPDPSLGGEIIKKVESISWDSHFLELLKYKAHNGHANPSKFNSTSHKDYELAIWLNKQRLCYLDRLISPARVQKLRNLGCVGFGQKGLQSPKSMKTATMKSIKELLKRKRGTSATAAGTTLDSATGTPAACVMRITPGGTGTQQQPIVVEDDEETSVLPPLHRKVSPSSSMAASSIKHHQVPLSKPNIPDAITSASENLQSLSTSPAKTSASASAFRSSSSTPTKPGEKTGDSTVAKPLRCSQEEDTDPEAADKTWDTTFLQLQYYKEQNGHANPPRTWDHSRKWDSAEQARYLYWLQAKLHKWLIIQRSDFRKGTLSSDKVKKLVDLGCIGFDMNKAESGLLKSWDSWFVELQHYKDRKLHANPPVGTASNPEDFRLAVWVKEQRKGYQKGLLPLDKAKQLHDLGCHGFGTPSKKGRDWETRFMELQEYKALHGHANPVRSLFSNEAEVRAGSWLRCQRNSFQSGTLPPDKIQKLQDLGCTGFGQPDSNRTTTISATWYSCFLELYKFKVNNGHANPSRSNKDFWLANWLGQQQTSFQDGSLSQEKAGMLQDVGCDGFGMTQSETYWHGRFAELQNYKVKNGDPNPILYVFGNDFPLAKWFDQQRASFREGTLPRDKGHMLLDLGCTGFELVDSRNLKSWDQSFMDLHRYKVKNGHANPTGEGCKLADWLGRQQESFKNGKLSPGRVRKLFDIGCNLGARIPGSRR